MIGIYITDQAPGAYPNGSRVVKVKAEPGDRHAIGATATVLGSVSVPAVPEIGFGYFVQWDEHPDHAVFVTGAKIALSTTH